uniref:Secreted protein n=1 Tax=Steinernema glaseri TaxID=37863 RepID=A0A1I8AQ23_9BILA
MVIRNVGRSSVCNCIACSCFSFQAVFGTPSFTGLPRHNRAVSLLNYGRHRRRCPVPQLRKYPGGFRWIGACPDSDGVLLLRHPPDFPYQHILLHQDRQ